MTMNRIPPWRRQPHVVLLAAVLFSSWSLDVRADDSGIDFAKERRFWSFQPPVAPVRPAVKNSRWPKQELDHFVLARLEAKRLAPTQEAEKRTLIRRATFDLTGLPP